MSFPSVHNRRTFLKGGVSLAGLAMIAATGGCESLVDAIKNRPVRKRAGTAAAAGDMAVYADAVAAMKALPPSDPRSWSSQADIHFSFCPHGNWYFLPWHRAYLYYFERICRELTGENDFALPYWNWQADRAIPGPFWSGALNDTSRSAGPSSQAGLSYVGPSVMQSILNEPNFEQFGSYASTALRGGGGAYGSLEATPHNNIHGFVGGNMGGYHSPLDPVFWCHHNMVDCVWDKWNNELGNLNTSDPAWTQFNLAGMFVDGDGSPAEMTCGLTTILPLISYRFAASAKGETSILTSAVFSKEVMQAGGNIRFSIKRRISAGGAANLAVGARLSRRIAPNARLVPETGERLLLRATGVHPQASGESYIRVFVNLPQARPATPITDPHYAGSIGFFMDPEARMQMPDTYYVDVTDTVARLQAGGMITASDPVTLTLLHAARETGRRRAEAVRVGALELVTTPAATRGK